MRRNYTNNQMPDSGAARLQNLLPTAPSESPAISPTQELPSKTDGAEFSHPRSDERSRRLTSKFRKKVEVDPELARSSDIADGCEAEPASRSAPVTISANPEALYPHLHVMLRLRKVDFAEAYTRKETREILGVSEKTLQRWIDQGRLEIYGLPDVCASAADIEKCLNECRSRTKKYHQALDKSGLCPD